MKFGFWRLSTAVILLSVSWSVLAAPDEGSVDRTPDFIGYLSHLRDARLIDVPELKIFIEKLQNNELVNPVSERLLSESIGFDSLPAKLARTKVQEYIDSAQIGLILINRETVLSWAQVSIQVIEGTGLQRKEVSDSTKRLDKKISFNLVRAGEFQMKIGKLFSWNRTMPVRLTRNFEMQSDQVSEWQWINIMKRNPARHMSGELGLIKVRPLAWPLDVPFEDWIDISYKIGHRIWNVSWDEIKEFIDRLNTLSNSGDLMLNELIEDYRVGDQFRLPTEAEWYFVTHNRGNADRNIQCAGVDQIEKFNPLLVDGKVFYGFNNQSSEWMEDGAYRDLDSWFSPIFIEPKKSLRYPRGIPLKFQVDPVGSSVGSSVGSDDQWSKELILHVMRMAWSRDENDCRQRGIWALDSSFRLVRMRSHQSESVSE